MYDAISPRSVGRYGDNDGADSFRKEVTEPNLVDLSSLGVDYLPAVFPGLSWYNYKGVEKNAIPPVTEETFCVEANIYNSVDPFQNSGSYYCVTLRGHVW